MATIFGQQTPGDGLSLQTIECRLTAHDDISRGDLLAVGLTVSSDGAKFTHTSNVDNDNLSIRDQDEGVLVVALEDVDSGAVGRFALQGVVEVMVRKSSADAADVPAVGGTVTAQEVLPGGTPPHVGNAVEERQAGHKIIGYTMAASTDGQLVKVMFDGLSGFGQA